MDDKEILQAILSQLTSMNQRLSAVEQGQQELRQTQQHMQIVLESEPN